MDSEAFHLLQVKQLHISRFITCVLSVGGLLLMEYLTGAMSI